jgi:hypothetical protein
MRNVVKRDRTIQRRAHHLREAARRAADAIGFKGVEQARQRIRARGVKAWEGNKADPTRLASILDQRSG